MEKFNLRYLKPSAFILICTVLALSLYAANTFIMNHWGISISIVALITGLFSIINRRLWNRKPFIWMYSVPDFKGRYTGTLYYEYRDDKNDKISDTLEHIKVINQNGSDIVVNSWTKKKDGSISSMSTSIEASIVKEKDGTFSIIFNYLNDGSIEPDYAPHYGTEVLKLIENGEGKYLTGKYYTSRLPYQTKGTTDLKYINNKLHHEK
jgi:hypothetical protein